MRRGEPFAARQGELARLLGLAMVIMAIATALSWAAGVSRVAATTTPRSCGWILEPTADRENILFPDITTRYLAAALPVPPGGSIEITGEFPHARYMSLQTYSSTLQSISDLKDTAIEPDSGSHNPFLDGASRLAAARNYTVHVVAGRAPAGGGPANTLYEQSSDGSSSGFGLAYRVYLPDRADEPYGGVATPSLTLVLATGTRIPLPQCPDLVPDTSALTRAIGQSALPAYALPAVDLIAQPTPVWHKYVNAPTSYGLGVTDNPVLGSLNQTVQQIGATLPSGLGENADNKYVYTFLSREYGDVAVLHARLPSTPRTRDGEAAMGTGQLRYWSICTGNRLTQAYGCLVDEDMPVDANGDFTLVVSPAAARPSNATTACGVGWLPDGPDLQGILIMRNMLPDPSFAEAIQNATPGTEAQTLGPYYPTGRYYANAAAYEQTGCHPPAAP